MNARMALIVVGCMLVPIAASAGESTGYEQPGYWKCQNIQASPTSALYVSDIFEKKADPAEVSSAFQQMLAAKYGVKTQVSCSMAYKGAGILEKLKDDDQRWFAQVRATGASVTETHWSFAPESAKFVYQCWGGTQVASGVQRVNHFFYADPIELAGDNEAKLAEAWIAHLADLHPGWFFAGAEGCQRLGADPSTHAGTIEAIMAPWKAKGAEMHKLDWKYAPLQKSAADDAPSVFCQALRGDNKSWYVTPVFPMVDVAQANAAMNAWRTYVHGLKDPEGYVVGDSYMAGCDGPGRAKDMAHQKAARAEQIRDAGGRIVETGWLPGAAASAPSVSAAASSATTFQCTMTSFGGNYVTPGFESAKDAATLAGDWRAYITKAHPVQGVVRTNCAEIPAQQAAATLAQAGWKRVDWKE